MLSIPFDFYEGVVLKTLRTSLAVTVLQEKDHFTSKENLKRGWWQRACYATSKDEAIIAANPSKESVAVVGDRHEVSSKNLFYCHVSINEFQ